VTAIVEEVLSQSHVSGACALLARVMGEAVLNHHAFAEILPTSRCRDGLAELLTAELTS